MKDFTKRYLILNLAISFIAIVLSCPVCPVIAGNNTKNQDKRTVRVTTGIEQVQGWEQGLVKANPNLARWHWDPIYSYKQGYATITPETAKQSSGRIGKASMGNLSRPAYNYNVPAPQDNRPKHIPFSSKALEEVRAKYMSPQEVLPAAQPSEQSVFGQISNKHTQATLASPTVATYGRPYASEEKTALQYSSQKASVYGQLLNTKKKVHYNEVMTVKQTNKK